MLYDVIITFLAGLSTFVLIWYGMTSLCQTVRCVQFPDAGAYQTLGVIAAVGAMFAMLFYFLPVHVTHDVPAPGFSLLGLWLIVVSTPTAIGWFFFVLAYRQNALK